MMFSETRGLRISKYTLGTVQLGISYGIANKDGKPDREKASRLLGTALEGGINSIDTAAGYGDSEQVLGRYFASGHIDPQKLVITTKFIVSEENASTPASIEKQIRESVEKSLRNLGLARIPILLLHHAGDMNQYGPVVRDTVEKLKSEGLVERAGVSVYDGRDIEEMLSDDLYEATQLPMNIFDQKLIRSGILQKLHDRDFIVFVRSIFLQGLFFLKPEELSGPMKEAEASLRLLNEIAENEGVTVGQLALAFIRDLEGVTSLVIGAETPEQVKENIQLMNAPALSAATREKILQAFGRLPNHVINPYLWTRPELWKEWDERE